jgi:LemA protein
VYAFSIYNSLIQKRISTDNAWSQIDVQLKRRHDLIPNLLETVKGYAAHEKETLERVVQARNSAMTASNAHNLGGQIQAEQALTGALRQVFALSESYPDLKANTNFQQLQEELTSTENRIGFARQAYNDAVALYMTAIEQIPGNLVRGFGSFPAKSFFELDPADATVVRSVPKVSF